MARKLIDIEAAARLLGVTPEDVNTFRERGDLRAYRDGGGWKFNQEDVDRLAADRAAGIGESGDLLDAPLELTEDTDNILLSEVELGNSPETTSSTIIGKEKKSGPSDSDIQIGKGPPPLKKGGSDIGVGSSDLKLSPSDSAKQFEDELDLALEGPGASDLKLAGSGKAGGSELKLEEELQEGSTSKGKKAGSDLKLGDEDDLVLGGSDVTLGTGDSGIGLAKPSESGLSLDQPLELAGSNIEMMELGEDDVVSLEEEADLESATQLKADDDFLLTPMSDGGADDSSDSGSQVIALEEDGDFAAAGAGMVQQPGMLVEDQGMGGFGMAAAAAPGMMQAPQVIYAPTVPEAAFSIWNVLTFFLTAIILFFGGMMIYDLVRNMWSWDQPYQVNSNLMDAILKWFEK